MRSGLAVLGDGDAGTSTASWSLRGGGALLRAVREADFAWLVDLNLMTALGLLEALGLLVSVAGGGLGALVALVVTAIDAGSVIRWNLR